MPRPDSQFGVSDGPAFNVPDYTGIDDFDVEMAEMMSPEQLSEQAAIFSAAHAQRRPY
ncbi:MAG: hypothetical protein LBI20_01020 [Holosporales bacterium]|nr:hypothetical protein [Holosporales bacterium]